MMSLQPSARLSCEQYLKDARGTVFPAAFYNFFHDVIASTNDLVSSTGGSSELGQLDLQDGIMSGTSTPVPGRTSQAGQDDTVLEKQERTLSSNADDVLNAIWIDFERIQRHIADSDQKTAEARSHKSLSSTETVYPVQLHLAHLESHVSLPNAAPDEGWSDLLCHC
jgi:phosphoinositide-3-kinase regulatory subunit 4